MKILIVGGTGTIGQAIVKELAPRHTLLLVGQKHGDLTVNMTDPQSIQALYEQTGKIDAVVIAAGQVHFADLTHMDAAKYQIGLNHKLMGQINLVLEGIPFMTDNGSFTLTSGILNRDPIRSGTSASMVNGAIEGFVKAAAIELPRGIRINAVSPTVIAESWDKYGPFFRGFSPVPAAQAALAYSKSVEGAQTGQVYYVG